MTQAEFAQQCAFIAKKAADWAGDVLTLPEDYARPVDPKAVARFTDGLREHLDRIDRRAGRQALQEKEGGE